MRRTSRRALTQARRYLLLGGTFASVADLFVLDDDQLGEAIELAGDDPDRLEAVLTALRQRMPTAATTRQIAALADRVDARRAAELRVDATRPDASPDAVAALAELDVREGHPSDAIPLFTRALAQRFGILAWRLELAQTELDTGHPAEAAKQANVVLSLRPDSEAAARISHAATTRAATGR